MVTVAGFGPFCGIDTNPGEMMVRWLARHYCRRCIRKHAIRFYIVPVSVMDVESFLKQFKSWQTILWIGVDASATHAWLEQGAQNTMQFACPDNRGFQPKRPQPIESSRSLSFQRSSRFSAASLSRDLRKLGFQVYPRANGGTFVSNYSYYRALQQQNGRSLYLHLPLLKTRREWIEATSLVSVLLTLLARRGR
jgi:pyrrolidone-carboxylate peptidase